MKHKIKHSVVVSKSLLAVVVTLLLLPVLNSCQKSSPTDTTELLSTVPSSASAVVGVNLRSLLEKAGCKVDGTRIKASKELESALERQSELNSAQKEAIKLFLTGESGVDPEGAIYFVDAYDNYVTAAVADENKFTEYVSSQTGSPFGDAGNNVRVSGNVALIGTQMWMNIGSSSIDSKAIYNYSHLEVSQSFLSTPFGNNIASMTDDITGWGRLSTLMGAGNSFGGLSYANLIMGMLFENATGVNFQMDFQKGKLNVDALLVNDKGDPAKYLLPADKIDTRLVEDLSQNAGFVVAAQVTKELTKKIEKIAGSLGGSLLGDMSNKFGSIDGTVAIACTDIDDMDTGVSGVVTTDGNPTIALTSLISTIAPIRKEEKRVYFSKNVPAGEVSLAEAANFMKGATLAFIGSVDNMKGSARELVAKGVINEEMKKDNSRLKTFGMALRPAGKGLKIDIQLTNTDQKENILVTFLKSAN